jgi:3-deoxy-D-manno-octulosonic-acid transferase
MLFFYNIGNRLFGTVVFLLSFFKPKAKQWVDGRKNWQDNFKQLLKPNEKRIWIHCASLGEFEQGRNLTEAIKNDYPSYKIVLTFFSPSGYEVRKSYEYADYVFYLPLDTKSNAKQFVQLINPSLAIFVKYEFWYHYLNELHQQKIPTIIISAAFRKEQPFFKWYGNLFRKMLQNFTAIFVQDEASKTLLQTIGIDQNVIAAGDTRYDRVLSIAANIKPLPSIKSFINNDPVLIAGSTWPDDEKIIQESFHALTDEWKLIIAPHEVNKERIEQIKKLFPDAILYSDIKNDDFFAGKRTLIIDNIGMLSSLYAYGKIAFVGGGFQNGGIHNILEPAVFGIPVLFGPVYKKFIEADKLVSLELCFSIDNSTTYKELLIKLSTDELYYQSVHQSLLKFMMEQAGATGEIMNYLHQSFMNKSTIN